MYLKLLLVQSMLPPIPIFCPTPNLLKLQLRKVFTLKTCDLGGLGLSVALSHRALSQSDERAMPRGSIHRAIGHPMLEFCVCRFKGNSFGSFPLCENVIFDLIWVTKTTLDIYTSCWFTILTWLTCQGLIRYVQSMPELALPTQLKIASLFPAQLNLHNWSCTSSKRAPASLAALNSPICKDLLLLRVPHRSSADTVQYKSNGLWRSWQSRWAGGVDQDVRMRTKRRGWWWRGGHRGGHRGAQSTPPHCHSPRLDPTGLLCAGKDPPFGPRSIVRRCPA